MGADDFPRVGTRDLYQLFQVVYLILRVGLPPIGPCNLPHAKQKKHDHSDSEVLVRNYKQRDQRAE